MNEYRVFYNINNAVRQKKDKQIQKKQTVIQRDRETQRQRDSETKCNQMTWTDQITQIAHYVRTGSGVIPSNISTMPLGEYVKQPSK